MMQRILIASAVFTASAFSGVGMMESITQRTFPAKVKEAPVLLRTAGDFVILAKSGISTVPASEITGDIAVSPITGDSMTGFSFSKDSEGRFSTSAQLRGKAFAANYNTPIPARLTSAVSDMETAYTDAAGRLNPDAARTNNAGGYLGGAFGGYTTRMTPGVYTFGSDVQITGDIFLEGTGFGKGQSETDVFVIQISGNLIQAAHTQVFLLNGARAENVFWQVAGNVQIGAGAKMEGTLLIKTDVTFITKSSHFGRILSQTAVNLQMARITEPPSY